MAIKNQQSQNFETNDAKVEARRYIDEVESRLKKKYSPEKTEKILKFAEQVAREVVKSKSGKLPISVKLPFYVYGTNGWVGLENVPHIFASDYGLKLEDIEIINNYVNCRVYLSRKS